MDVVTSPVCGPRCAQERPWWRRAAAGRAALASGAARRKTFATTARGLRGLGDWLLAHGVTDVAMESTGVYWRPVYAVLEDAVEVSAGERAARQDGAGAQDRCPRLRVAGAAARMWPAARELRAAPPVRDLRDLTRLRKALIRSAATTSIASRRPWSWPNSSSAASSRTSWARPAARSFRR